MQVRTVGEMKAALSKYPDAMPLTGYNGSDSPDVPISIYPQSPLKLVKMKLMDGSEKDIEVEMSDKAAGEGVPLPPKLTVSVCH